MNRQVYLHALGCRLNEAEIQAWARDFQIRGYGIGSAPEVADLVVLNTCAVTQEAARKSRQLIRRAQRFNPQAKLVVTGCFASLTPTAVQAIDGVDLVIDNRDKDRLVDIALRELDFNTMGEVVTEPGAVPLFALGRNRAFVKVQDGCRYRCTFCVVTAARGQERSRSIADVVEEISSLTARGVKEAVLSGVHLGGYGNDIGGSLFDLINALLADTDLPRLRLGSLEPWDLPGNFFDLFRNPRLMPHLHLPLQSGSDTVLRRMARRCKTRDFQQLIARARDEVPDFSVTTDIIVGFPGETEREWQEGLQFIETIGFSHIHLFGYSPRQGTKAAHLPGQIPKAIKQQRSRQLHQLGRRMKQESLKKYMGRVLPILWENSTPHAVDGLTRYTGYTPNFLRVHVKIPTGKSLDNEIEPARIHSLTEGQDAALAELLNEAQHIGA